MNPEAKIPVKYRVVQPCVVLSDTLITLFFSGDCGRDLCTIIHHHIRWNDSVWMWLHRLHVAGYTWVLPLIPDTWLIWIITKHACNNRIFFRQENGHFKWHKSWYILLCYPLCETWFIISQKLRLSLKSSVSLLWFKTGALTLHPSGLLLSGSLYV